MSVNVTIEIILSYECAREAKAKKLNLLGKGSKKTIESVSMLITRWGGVRDVPLPLVPAKTNILYSRGSFVDIVCWTVG